MRKLKLEQELIEFTKLWNCEELVAFLRDIIPLFELYDIEDEKDWVEEAVGEEDSRNVRMIRMIYLVSKIADFHAGRLCRLNSEHKRLWKRMEDHVASLGPIV